MFWNICLSVSVSLTFRLAITRSATAKNFASDTSVKPALEPSEKLGTKLRGKPVPWMFTPTPITVAVLNMLLTPAFE